MSQSKFKIGDLVRRKRGCEDIKGAIGQIGRVTDKNNFGNLYVEYLDPTFQELWLERMGSHTNTPSSWFEPYHTGFTLKLAAPVFSTVDEAIAEATRISTTTGIPCEVVAI